MLVNLLLFCILRTWSKNMGKVTNVTDPPTMLHQAYSYNVVRLHVSNPLLTAMFKTY
jgi:hypothetical protein